MEIKMPALKTEESARKYREFGKLRRAIHSGMTLAEMEEYVKTGNFPVWMPEIGYPKKGDKR